MNKSGSCGGFSIVELVVGLAVLIFIALTVIFNLKTFNRLQTKSDQTAKLNTAMQRVLDQYRMLATSAFASMEWPLRLEIQSGSISVWGAVGSINSANRTRPATIYAEIRENGVFVSSRGVQADLTQIRGKTAGARFIIRAVDQYSGLGIRKVRVTNKGQDLPQVEALTDELGYATVQNVFQTSNPSMHTVFGDAVPPPGPYFFDLQTNPPTYSFSKSFPTPPILAGQTIDLSVAPYGPYLMSPSGTVAGTITHALNASGVSGYDVWMHPIPGTMLLPVTEGFRYTRTNAAGGYEFTGVIPGKYRVFPMGTSVYPALAEPRDLYYLRQNNVAEVNVTAASTVQQNFTTLPRGTLKGKIRLAKIWSGGVFGNISTTAQGGKIEVYPNYPVVYDALGPSGTWISMYDTTYAQTLLLRDPNSQMITFVADSQGDYTKVNFLPTVIHRSSTYDRTMQYTNFFPRSSSHQTLASNAVPVVILNPDTAPKALISYRSNQWAAGTTYALEVRPRGSDQRDFQFPVYLNQNNPGSSLNPNQDLYLMHTSELSRLKGKVLNSGGGPQGGVKLYFEHGGIRQDGNGVWIDKDFFVTSQMNGSFDSGKTLIGDFAATDESVIRAVNPSPMSVNTLGLLAEASFYVKVRENNQIFIKPQTPSGVTVTLEFYKGPNLMFSVPNCVFVSNWINQSNVTGFVKNAGAELAQTFVHVDPGQTKDENDDPALTINLNPPSASSWEGYSVRAVPPPGSPWIFTWGGGGQGPTFMINGSQTAYERYRGGYNGLWTVPDPGWTFVFNKLLRMVAFKGKVTYNGAAVTNIRVRLSFTSAPKGWWMYTNYQQTQSDICGGNQYCFQNIDFLGIPGDNFGIEWSDPSGTYRDGAVTAQGYDSCTLHYDIKLLRRSTGGGGT